MYVPVIRPELAAEHHLFRLKKWNPDVIISDSTKTLLQRRLKVPHLTYQQIDTSED